MKEETDETSSLPDVKKESPSETQPAAEADEKKPEKNTSSDKEAASGASEIINRPVSWGFEKSSARKIDTIVIHTSYNSLGGDEYSVEKIIGIYKDYGVSAHYIVARNGNIYQLVDDQNISYHAGESKMPDGRAGVNNFSIGIEVVNTKSGKFTGDQYESLNNLISDLKGKYPIKNILGHSDIAPGRKDDPWGMEWGKVDK